MKWADTDTATDCQVQWAVRQRLGYGTSRSSSLGTGDKWPMDYIQNNPNARERSVSEIYCWLTFVTPNRILAPFQCPAENTTESYKSLIHSIRTYIHTYIHIHTNIHTNQHTYKQTYIHIHTVIHTNSCQTLVVTFVSRKIAIPRLKRISVNNNLCNISGFRRCLVEVLLFRVVTRCRLAVGWWLPSYTAQNPSRAQTLPLI